MKDVCSRTSLVFEINNCNWNDVGSNPTGSAMNRELSHKELMKVINLEKELNKNNKYAHHRLLPFPHLRWNYFNIARDLLPIESIYTNKKEKKGNE